MILNNEQCAAVDQLQAGGNAFLTGSAGTGKSTVTTAFISAATRRVDIAATTGIAAINLRDQFAARSDGREINVGTIYRWAGIGLGPKEGQDFEAFWKWWYDPESGSQSGVRRRIKKCETLIIDEVSMLPGRILNYIDWHCQRIRGNPKPFGGIQVIAVGDFLQLPPVNKGGKGYDWAFMSESWGSAGFKPLVLRQVHRQADPEFLDLLGDFRTGRMSRKSMATMQRRVALFPSAAIPRLLTHNSMVDKWNAMQLSSLPEPEVKFLASVVGGQEYQRDWLIKNMVTPHLLILREGARVMVTANLPNGHGGLMAVNGTMGTVLEMKNSPGERFVVIEDDDGNVLSIERHTWDYDRQDENSATFSQIPLRPAWATTIHKAQGLSLNQALIDVRAAREPGQAYVALSRVRTLAGLHLKAVPGGTFVSPAAVSFQRELLESPEEREWREPAEECDY